MSESRQQNIPEEIVNSMGSSGISRKDFFKYAGAAGAAVATAGMIGCSDDEGPSVGENGVFLGTGDIGVLNYAYALEQLEAAFYVQVTDTPYEGMTEAEGKVFADIRDHEVAHRDFYNAAINAVGDAIPGLTPNFSEIDFSSKASVVGTAKVFENTGVSAYNGAGALLNDATFLVVAGKIVSVEARHAAAIYDIAQPSMGVAGTYVTGDPVINQNGLDLAQSPSQVLGLVAPYIREQIDASGLPQPQ